MKRRFYIIGTVALGLMIAAIESGPGLRRVISSAEQFQNHFEDLRQSGASLNPVERFVFSIVLTGTKTPQGPAPATSPTD